MAKTIAEKVSNLEAYTREQKPWKKKYEALKKENDLVNEELKTIHENMEKLSKKSEDLKTLEEWKAKYGTKCEETMEVLGTRIKKLTAERKKSDKQIKKLKGELKLFQEFKEVMGKLLSPLDRELIKRVAREKSDIPSELSISTEQPEISVKVERKVLELTDKKLLGKLTILYAEGEFGNEWFTINDVTKMFQKRAWNRDPRVSKMLDKMVRWNFFEKRLSAKARPEYKVKLSHEEAKAKGLIKAS